MSGAGVSGLVLAAGAGTRMGRPKALVRGADGEPWLGRSVRVLREGGCTEVVVVLGAAGDQARALVPDGVTVVEALDWAEGMSASLRAGLDHLTTTGAEAAVVLLVDLPDLVPAVVARLLPAGAGTLARAAYDAEPGHPVVLGRDHWAGVVEASAGDHGARDYLRAHVGEVRLVACEDLATGVDQDHPTPSPG